MNGDLYPIRYLNELMDEQGVTISYRLVYMGDNLSPAIIEATTSGHSFVARGIEWTIADAKVKAAVSFLEHLGHVCEQTISEKAKMFRKNVETQLKLNPIGTLQNLCVQRGWRFPLYQYQGFGPNQSHIIKCTVEYYWAKATCRAKHEAKRRVAEMVFRMIVDLREPTERPVENERSSSLPSGLSSFDLRPSSSSKETLHGLVCVDVGQGPQTSSVSSECSAGFCHDPLDSSSQSTGVPVEDLTKVSDLVISEVCTFADDKCSEPLTIVSPLDSEGSSALFKEQVTEYPDTLPTDQSHKAANADCVTVLNGPKTASGSSTNVSTRTSPEIAITSVDATPTPGSTDTILEPSGSSPFDLRSSFSSIETLQGSVCTDVGQGAQSLSVSSECTFDFFHNPLDSSSTSTVVPIQDIAKVSDRLMSEVCTFTDDKGFERLTMVSPLNLESSSTFFIDQGTEYPYTLPTDQSHRAVDVDCTTVVNGPKSTSGSSTNFSAWTSPENEISSADATTSPSFADTVLEPTGKSDSLDLHTIAQSPFDRGHEIRDAREPDVCSPVVGSSSPENHLQEPPTGFVEDSEGQEPVENGEGNESVEPSKKTRFSKFKRARKCLKNVGWRLLCCCRASTED